MTQWKAALYGLGRLTFGGGLIAAPGRIGTLLMGDQAAQSEVRVALRAYGTRDTVLGLGTLAALRRGDVAPWIAAGITSDVLDAALQATDWQHLPPGRRGAGVATAAASAAVGIALLLEK